MTARMLIIDDDPNLNQMLQLHFEDAGYGVIGVERCEDGLTQLRRTGFDLVLLDQQLPDGKGLDLLKRIKVDCPEQAVIMMTGQHDLELAIQAIKEGAADFIHKPIKINELQIVVDRVLEHLRLNREVVALHGQLPAERESRELIGRSDAMLKVSKEIALSAQSNTNILITGESGTGKEVVARLIHQHSGRTGPFVPVNCAAIVDTLMESELFGHEKGAFTGAIASKPGKFELAQDGTIFLDEIGELALPLQAKLLRTLQEQTYERVGGTRQMATNARVLTATNRDLATEVAAGRFREDLVYRLKVVSIHLPPLRNRSEDIPLLTEALIERISRRIHKPALPLTGEAMNVLVKYHWPGNVRELENALTQALVHARGERITPDLIPIAGEQHGAALPRTGDTSGDAQVLRSLEEVEAEHIQRVLLHTGGHKGLSCDLLGISRPALDRKIKKYSLIVPGR